MGYGYTLHGHRPTLTIEPDGNLTTRWEDVTFHRSVELPVVPDKPTDPRLSDPGVMTYLRQLQRTLQVRNELDAAGINACKSAVEDIIMPEFGIDRSEAHHLLNIICKLNLRVPGDVARHYKIELPDAAG